MPSETSPLLPTSNAQPVRPRTRIFTRKNVFILALAITATLLFFLPHSKSQNPTPAPDTKPRNVIMMVSDGMGPASLALVRGLQKYRTHDESLTLNLDKHLLGSSRTRSSSSLITDSAAGATAFSCATKSYNGAIAVTDDHNACGTVLEAAKDAGYMTGIVVTSRLTDATPASFSAHASHRSMQDLIAEYQVGMGPLGRSVDLFFGGGLCSFLPNTSLSSCRSDDKDLIDYAANEQNFTVLLDRSSFDEVSTNQLPILGIFSDYHLNFNVDRDNTQQPALSEMVAKALDILTEATKDSEKGFFLLVEGSRIDMAAHNNDPVGHVYDVIEYDRTFGDIVDYAKSHQTVVVSTSDHETGGLTVGRQLTDDYPVYRWFPEYLAEGTHSVEYLARALYATELSNDRLPKYVRETILPGLGVVSPNEEEVLSVMEAGKDLNKLILALSNVISRRAEIGWSTHGHTAVDVNIYGYGPHVKRLRGNHENTEVGALLQAALGVSLDAVTARLSNATVVGNQLLLSEDLRAFEETDSYLGCHQDL
ncbi:vacuolar membrane alkaline phosphatase [Schizosaccharomyces japonicus yFS275]|uniref:Alkaline phosphatase n=1 Tax=Schizosaccharomyces japonicus (strain yFS275 / FY16936) TaxID=402676 RepID=B6K1C8_SCHJY|nr:vacuolar membrane alkaline phosphatase [Schizosaccharomyces japonicus yFS275]EEB07749.1 vacuolar membrane alkaline phosphatase [Schizosaccharomyces japonicus yFS275]